MPSVRTRVLAASAAAAWLFACGGASDPAPPAAPVPAPAAAPVTTPAAAGAPPNVLLVVIDTLGAFHVGCYGDAQGSTPNLDRAAAAGRRFERAYATAPWTQPSIASIFTSQMPSSHGVQGLANRLPDRAATLAALLRHAGFRTHGVVSNFLISDPFGFNQGFTSFDTTAVSGHEGITSEKVTDAALRWLDKHGSERFFLFVHYFDPHYAYNDHPDLHLADGYSGPVTSGMPIWDLRAMRKDLGPRDVEELVALYREEVAHTDQQVGRLLARVAELGLDPRTLVVLTADHGEELMGHGWIGHTRTLYDELLRVPLILRWPGVVEPGVVRTPVSLLDLAPTILELVAQEKRPASWQGQPFTALLRGPPPPSAGRDLFAEVAFRPLEESEDDAAEKVAFKTALVSGDWKLIHDELSDAFELYDCASDPLEHANRWGEDPERDARLRAELLDWERARATAHAETVAPADEQLEELRKLGYAR